MTDGKLGSFRLKMNVNLLRGSKLWKLENPLRKITGNVFPKTVRNSEAGKIQWRRERLR